MKIKAIAAMTESRVIGRENGLPWHLPEDMKHFVSLTKGNTVLMGRRTFESKPMNGRPLPKRLNVVVTRSPEKMPSKEGVRYSSDPIAFLEAARSGTEDLPSDTVWVIGGAEIYRQTLPLWDDLHLTVIKGEYEGDAHFPPFEDQFELVSEEDIGPCIFRHYTRKPS